MTRWPSLFPGPAVYMFSVNLKSHLSVRWDGSQTIRAVFDNFGCSKSNLSSLLSIFEFLWWVSASPIPFSARRRHALPVPFSAPSPAFPYMLLFLWIGYSASPPAAAAALDRGPSAGLLTIACPFGSWYRCFLLSSSCTMDTVLPQQYQGLSQSSPATPSTLLSCRLYLPFPLPSSSAPWSAPATPSAPFHFPSVSSLLTISNNQLLISFSTQWVPIWISKKHIP